MKYYHQINQQIITLKLILKIIDNILNNFIVKIFNQLLLKEEQTLQSFIDANTWDEARIFTTKKELVQGVIAPNITGMVSGQRN